MWVADLKILKEKSTAVKATERFNVVIQSFYLNVFKHRGKAFVNRVIVVKGPDKNAYIDFFKKIPSITIRAVEGDKVFYCHKPINALNSRVADSTVTFVKPVTASKGFEYWTVASWDKKKLTAFIRKVGKVKGVKVTVLSLKQKEVDIFLSSALNKLSAKQLNALTKAVAMGYYEFPRRHSLEQVAASEDVDESTLREHLRKAESIILKGALDLAAFQ